MKKKRIVEGRATSKGVGGFESGKACKLKGTLGTVQGEYWNEFRIHSSCHNLLPEEELVITVETCRSGASSYIRTFRTSLLFKQGLVTISTVKRHLSCGLFEGSWMLGRGPRSNFLRTIVPLCWSDKMLLHFRGQWPTEQWKSLWDLFLSVTHLYLSLYPDSAMRCTFFMNHLVICSSTIRRFVIYC